jgi:hypothetical protein
VADQPNQLLVGELADMRLNFRYPEDIRHPQIGAVTPKVMPLPQRIESDMCGAA